MSAWPCNKLIGVVLLASLLAARDGVAQERNLSDAPSAQVGDVATLRTAIADLAATFGSRYPRGREFLARLEKLDAADSAGLAALQREALLENPLLCGQPILFVVRQQYAPDHHNTATFFQQGEINAGKYAPPGIIKCIDLAHGGAIKTLIDLGPTALARDPEISFDGSKIIFSARRNIADGYHIYQANSDGSGVRQLTTAAGISDIDPLYLPDGGIVFTSTREPKYCMCNRHIMGNLFRMNGDGSNIHQIGKSTLHEGHASLMPDGRIMYDRWEYVDRNFGTGQSLWTVNPDGTDHEIYWGSNLTSPAIEGRMIGDGSMCLAILTACHDRPWGALALLDRRLGVDTLESVTRTWPAGAAAEIWGRGFDAAKKVVPKYQDPYPLSGKYFLVSRQSGPRDGAMTIYLVDTFGNEVPVHGEAPGCFDPMPMGPRTRPPAIPIRRTYDDAPGRFFVQDVYNGTHMQGVARGTIKFLRVIESPEKRFFTSAAWNGQGTEAPGMNWDNFENKRILGTVPVESDGSACFETPPGRYVFFQLLDADGMMVQSMRSGTIIQPGETQGCVGCHDSRRNVAQISTMASLALRRPASKLEGWHGSPRIFSFMNEVQPTLTRHCASCHDFGKPAGAKLVLAGDRDPFFNAAYTEIWAKREIACVGAGPAPVQPAGSWGARASKLIQVLRQGHYDVHLDSEEMDRLITWVDLNGPYYPSYASAFPNNPAGRSPLTGEQFKRLKELTGVDMFRYAGHDNAKGAWISFDRPQLSPILALIPDKQGAGFREALAILQAGQQALQTTPRGDTADFTPCETDRLREARYARRAAIEAENLRAIREGRKVYDRDLEADPARQ